MEAEQASNTDESKYSYSIDKRDRRDYYYANRAEILRKASERYKALKRDEPKKYQCDVCNYYTPIKKNLEIHERSNKHQRNLARGLPMPE